MMRRLMAVTVVVVSVLAGAVNTAQSAGSESVSAVFKRVDASVVVIQTRHERVVTGPGQRFTDLAGMGSGVLISKDGKVMTASHVVHSADAVTVQFPDGEVVPAKVLSSERFADVALLQLERVPASALVAELADSDSMEVGDRVFVVGAPAGMSHTLTVGHISARRNPGYSGLSQVEFFQTDAAINQGNSGGPMFNMGGKVVGIVSHIISKSGGSEGLGFATTSNAAWQLLLEQSPFWSGIEGFLLAGPLARAFNVPQSAGLLVQRVVRQSPAQMLGLRAGALAAVIEGQPVVIGGDIILEVQDVRIIADPAWYSVVRERVSKLAPGDTVQVTILREGSKETLMMKVPASR